LEQSLVRRKQAEEKLQQSLHELDQSHQKIKTGFIETIYRLTVAAEYRDEETVPTSEESAITPGL